MEVHDVGLAHPAADREPARDLGVDEDAQVAAVLAHVHDDDLPMDVDLGRGQPDPLGGIHRLGQVVDKFARCGIDFFDAGGGSVQPRVGVLEDLEYGHKCLLIEQIKGSIYRVT